MTIRFHTSAAGHTTATFTITGDEDTIVSVVGSFNNWTPGQHPLQPDGDGSIVATVPVETGDELHFRYLAADGHWFDDPDADAITDEGSVIHVPNPSSEPTPQHQHPADEIAAPSEQATL